MNGERTAASIVPSQGSKERTAASALAADESQLLVAHDTDILLPSHASSCQTGSLHRPSFDLGDDKSELQQLLRVHPHHAKISMHCSATDVRHPGQHDSSADSLEITKGCNANQHLYERAYLLRVLASSIIGNALEWYDFLVYIYLGNVISRLFFPPSNTTARLLAYYGVFAAGFLTRPLGAAIFGRIGDKYGRKTALTLSIYIMSIPTALVGCLPTFNQARPAGLAAPVLLVLLRVLQGLAVGGEFTSTMVFLVEAAPPGRQGLYGSAGFFSVMVGVITGSLVAMTFNLALTDEHLYSWGWRVPFLVSILGSGVGIFIRKHLKEPPGLESHKHSPDRSGVRQVLMATFTVFMIDFLTAVGFYLVVIFLPLYFQEFAGLSRKTALVIHTANMALYMAVTPLGGWLFDRYGRMPVLLGPCLFLAAAAWPLWMVFKMHNAALAWLAQAVMSVAMGLFNGALPAAFIPLFAPGTRCTGVSVGHNLSMAAFGGTAPLMATGLLSATHDIASPAALMAAAACLSVAGLALMRRQHVHAV
ncbi:hypothetical protein QJQ45_014714 [Haematococcus lacustris]|nr:hypothetical protein QJQ45_014714 [Haematococcus lacustris]